MQHVCKGQAACAAAFENVPPLFCNSPVLYRFRHLTMTRNGVPPPAFVPGYASQKPLPPPQLNAPQQYAATIPQQQSQRMLCQVVLAIVLHLQCSLCRSVIQTDQAPTSQFTIFALCLFCSSKFMSEPSQQRLSGRIQQPVTTVLLVTLLSLPNKPSSNMPVILPAS